MCCVNVKVDHISRTASRSDISDSMDLARIALHGKIPTIKAKKCRCIGNSLCCFAAILGQELLCDQTRQKKLRQACVLIAMKSMVKQEIGCEYAATDVLHPSPLSCSFSEAKACMPSCCCLIWSSSRNKCSHSNSLPCPKLYICLACSPSSCKWPKAVSRARMRIFMSAVQGSDPDQPPGGCWCIGPIAASDCSELAHG